MLLSCYRDVVIFNPQMNKPIGVHNLAVSASSFEVDFIVLLTIIRSPVFHFLLKTIRPRLIATSIIINPRLPPVRSMILNSCLPYRNYHLHSDHTRTKRHPQPLPHSWCNTAKRDWLIPDAIIHPNPIHQIRLQIRHYRNQLRLALELIFMMLIPFYYFIHRKDIIREPDNFIRFRNKVDIVIHHITSISWRIE